ncbi:DNA binding methylated-DNA--cysteine S-methyltransferase [Annulohypoxylon moriforme]|nr:DNA binding methylated-DNA--cysteine S-methyltransferase [Annulohypoxylon moriforme]
MAGAAQEALEFAVAVFQAVQRIPFGEVATCGHIAKLLGSPHKSSQVGLSIRRLSRDPEAQFNRENVPWYRLVDISPRMPPRSDPSVIQEQVAALRAEGVDVAERINGFSIFFYECG